MPTRLTSVVIDSHDPAALGRWWAQALGWRVSYEDSDETDVEPPEGEPGIELTFVPVPDVKTVKNRVHLDLRTYAADEQARVVARLEAAGATRADVGQPADASFVVLADPEGNEFCVLDPRPHYGETGAVAAVVVDALDPSALAGFWVDVAGGKVGASTPGSVGVQLGRGPGPWIDFVEVPEPHTVKNRLHLDVRPYAGDDHGAEVERVIGLGAFRADIGQDGTETWTVLADPENNEFCILSPR